MKKILTISVLLMAVVATAFGQEENDEPESFWKAINGPIVDFRIVAGVNFSSVSDYFANGAKGSSLTGFKVGYEYNSKTYKNMGLRTGLYLTQKGQKGLQEFNGGQIVPGGGNLAWDLDITHSVWYGQLPVDVFYSVPVNSDLTLNPYLGFYYAGRLFGNCTLEGSNTPKQKQSPKKAGYKSSEFGYNIGVDAKYKGFALGLSYEHSATNVIGKSKYSVFSVTLGYVIPSKKK